MTKAPIESRDGLRNARVAVDRTGKTKTKTIFGHAWQDRKERPAIGNRCCGDNAPLPRRKAVNGTFIGGRKNVSASSFLPAPRAPFYHRPSFLLLPSRLVTSFVASEPFENNGMEWIRLTVEGQSFILHQIRKMVSNHVCRRI